MIKLQSVFPRENKKLEIHFSDGSSGVIDLSEYFDFIGVLEILKDEQVFKKVKIKNNSIHWTEDCELSPDTIYSIITKKKIIIDNKIVFDPELKKGAWTK